MEYLHPGAVRGWQAVLLLQAICVPKVPLFSFLTYWCFQQCQAFVGGVASDCWLFNS
jgi:hypothetical protein